MPIECYFDKCPHHGVHQEGGEGPFCDEPFCKASEKDMNVWGAERVVALQIEHMVQRFLAWKLPQDFYPDCYISFNREKASQYPHGWPVGTNLLTAKQAREMFEYVMTIPSE